MNNVTLIGRVANDIELKYGKTSETAITNFNLAVDKLFKKEGEDTADFIPVVCFGKTAEFAEKWFAKGMRIGVTGRLQSRKWKDADEKSHTVLEVLASGVEFADGKKNSFDSDGDDLPV